jgi:hypothetical protein
MNTETKSYASEFARLGGLTKSRARAGASRANGKLGGRPKKVKMAASPAENKPEKNT